MKKIIVIVAAALLGMSNMALAAGSCAWPYVGVIGGAAISGGGKLDTATGYVVGGVGGVEFCNARLEAEVAYRSSKIDYANAVRVNGDISLLSYMVNGLYELDLESKKWRPYFGGGLGLATADISALTSGGLVVNNSSSDTRFAYQGIGGIGYFATPHLVLDASYRYFSTLRYQLDTLSTNYTTHNVMFGARLRF